MMNNLDISDIEKVVTDAVRALGLSENVWNNRPSSTSDAISDFVVVKALSVEDRAAFGSCRISVSLFARDVRQMKNSHKLSIMQEKLLSLPLWIEPVLLDGHPRILGDTPDKFGFHARIVTFQATIKVS